MVREILKLKTDNGLGANNPSFKNIEITEYSFKSPRMGIPTLTAELLYPTCLDNEWTHKEYVELRGERYYIRQIQSSEISNNNVIKYKHSLDFKSEREQLLHAFFYDVVPSWALTYDRPNTNSTKFKFFGTLYEFCDRLNCAFYYAGIGDSVLEDTTFLTEVNMAAGDGYCVVISADGGGDLSQVREFEWEDQYLFDALSEGFNKYKIPFCFHGKTIVFNEYVAPIEYAFKYGFDDALLSIKKNNANARIINRITFKGSDENIPYYYPNETEYGHITTEALTGNSILTNDKIHIDKPTLLVRNTNPQTDIILKENKDAPLTESTLLYDVGSGVYQTVPLHSWVNIPYDNTDDVPYTVKYRLIFTTSIKGNIIIDSISGQQWITNNSYPPSNIAGDVGMNNIINSTRFSIESLRDVHESNHLTSLSVVDGSIIISNLNAGKYALDFRMTWHRDYDIEEGESQTQRVFWRINEVSITNSSIIKFYWESGDNKFRSLAALGISADVAIDESLVGEGFQWDGLGRIPFQQNLMPPKYRATLGAERFYNALNNTYLKPDGETYYTFKNPYVEGNPNEYIHTDETIKPTIEGVKNSKEELFGVISGIAFDSDDNDSLKGNVDSEEKDKNDSLNYVHSFFYLRLNKFDGEYGFDLFSSASQTDAMTIQMTSGQCNGCKFKIQVVESQDGDVEVWRNPVQTKGADGDIINGVQSTIIDKNNPQDWQQDTTKNYIWIAVQKDAETFGMIMPNRSHGFMPAVGDTFNIINIYLPQGYITAAEETGMHTMLEFMENNNEEKFNFDITASRIFFAEHPDLLALLNENSRIKIEYNGEQYVQYVSEFAIDCKDNDVLPDVKLTLTDTLEAGNDFISEVTAIAKNSQDHNHKKYASIINEEEMESRNDERYPRKDRSARFEHRLSSDSAFEVGNFVSGSSGGIFYVDPETGRSSIEVDYVTARLKAFFETVKIAHVQSIGGKMIITPGGSVDVSFVEETANEYRCYFKQKEYSQSAECRFKVGDFAICQSFNVSNGTSQNASNKFYWRKVTTVSKDNSFIGLSKTDRANGSGQPGIGDTICQLGSNDVARQSAIILSTTDDTSPNITLYDGISNFALTGKEMVDMGVDKDTGKAYLHVYGNTYIGDKEESSYVRYDNILKLLEIKAKLQIGTTVGDKSLSDYIKYISPPVNKDELKDSVYEDVKVQVDGKIESWFQTTDPAQTWVSYEDKELHNGDLWYNPDTKKLKFYKKTDQPIIDVETGQITYAFAWTNIDDIDALNAKSIADQKRRVFVDVPYGPYSIGDLWIREWTDGGITRKDLYRCSTARNADFDFNDWEIATSYDNTQVTIDSGIVTAGTIQLANGSSKGIVAGITGGENETANTNEESKVRIWSGASKENRLNAPFRVTQNGVLYSTKAFISGDVIISGFIKPQKTVVTLENYNQLLFGIPQPDGEIYYSMNFEKLLGYVEFEETMGEILSSSLFHALVLPSTEYDTSTQQTDFEVEDFIGNRLRIANKTTSDLTIHGVGYYANNGSDIETCSLVLNPMQECFLECDVRGASGKMIGWINHCTAEIQ